MKEESSVYNSIATLHNELCKMRDENAELKQEISILNSFLADARREIYTAIPGDMLRKFDALWKSLQETNDENAELKSRVASLESIQSADESRIHNLECANVELHILVAELRDDIGIPR